MVTKVLDSSILTTLKMTTTKAMGSSRTWWQHYEPTQAPTCMYGCMNK